MLSCSKVSSNTNHIVIFFPFAGGSGEYYLPWYKYFDDSVNCFYVTLKGRGSLFNEPAFDSLSELLDELVPEILKLPRVHLSFFGHSMGGLIAFELARKLYFDHNIIVENLFVSGFRAPQLPYKRKYLHTLPKEELYSSIKEMGGVPENVDLALLEPFLPTLYCDFKLCELYKYENLGKLPCNIHVLWGNKDLHIQKENLFLWQDESNNKVTFQEFDGDHFYLNNNQMVIEYINNNLRSY